MLRSHFNLAFLWFFLLFILKPTELLDVKKAGDTTSRRSSSGRKGSFNLTKSILKASKENPVSFPAYSLNKERNSRSCRPEPTLGPARTEVLQGRPNRVALVEPLSAMLVQYVNMQSSVSWRKHMQTNGIQKTKRAVKFVGIHFSWQVSCTTGTFDLSWTKPDHVKIVNSGVYTANPQHTWQVGQAQGLAGPLLAAYACRAWPGVGSGLWHRFRAFSLEITSLRQTPLFCVAMRCNCGCVLFFSCAAPFMTAIFFKVDEASFSCGNFAFDPQTRKNKIVAIEENYSTIKTTTVSLETGVEEQVLTWMAWGVPIFFIWQTQTWNSHSWMFLVMCFILSFCFCLFCSSDYFVKSLFDGPPESSLLKEGQSFCGVGKKRDESGSGVEKENIRTCNPVLTECPQISLCDRIDSCPEIVIRVSYKMCRILCTR